MASSNIMFERRGKGPPLLLMHGLGSSHRVWDPVRPLLEEYLDVIALDLPGHGASPAPMPEASSTRALALAIAACLDRLEIKTAHIAGNSQGGWLALELAKMGRARNGLIAGWAIARTRANLQPNHVSRVSGECSSVWVIVFAFGRQSHYAHDLVLAVLRSAVGNTKGCGY